jgi:hypothetical protein
MALPFLGRRHSSQKIVMPTYADDFAFVLQEIASFDPVAAIKSAATARRNSGMLASLPHPSGRGQMACSVAAYRRLRDVAETALTRSQFIGRVETEAVFKELKKITVQKFIRDGSEIDQRTTDRAVAAAVKAAGKSCVDLTHFVPCHLGHGKTPQSFSLGPVRFQQRGHVMQRLAPAFTAYVESEGAESPAGRDHLEFLSTDAQAYYNSFDWIAEVTVASCDPPTSRQRARHIVGRALDCLQLLIGADYSNHMRVGGPRFSTDRRGRVEMDVDGRIDISVSVDWLGHNLGENWWESVNSENGDELIALMGVALEAAHTSHVPAPMVQRFLDGAAWYGEAARDEFMASRVIKYVTAIERMLVTENAETRQIAETLATRGAALIHNPGIADLESLHKRFKAVYDLRSRLVHGSRSPLDQGFGFGLREAETLARSTLFRSLCLFQRDGLQRRDANDRDLESAFTSVLKWANETGHD